jgi:hypothetical protein
VPSKSRGSKPRSSKSAKTAAARARVAEMRAQEARRRRRRNWLTGIGAAVAAVLVAVGITLAVTLSGGSAASTPGGTPKLRLAALSTLGVLKAAPAPGPAGPEGVPVPAAPPLTGTATKTTGQQVGGQPLSTDRVGPATGKVTALYDGRVYLGDPADIPLTRHAQIQLEVGTPLVAPEQITFPSGL